MNKLETKLARVECLIGYLIYCGHLSFRALQKEITVKLCANKSSISKALNGDEKYLTDNFIERLNSEFGEQFNLEWLLTGSGNPTDNNISLISQQITNNNGIIAGRDVNFPPHLDDMPVETQTQYVRQIIKTFNQQKQHLLDVYVDTIRLKDKIIEKKERQIESRDEQITDLFEQNKKMQQIINELSTKILNITEYVNKN
ncbi:MAG: hypothetical protein LBJ17_08715 [Dysgonamonadaceae bacterium]|jgi:hypothetical protein|nr:hypothetical protein [Dysgonamonadaceae bacterium]